MPGADLQTLIDELGAALGRPVLLEDAALRPLAYSAHAAPSDAVRVSTILRRRAPEAVRQLLLRHGIAGSERPLRIPGRPDVGMEERVCVPLRWEGRALGYIWLVDAAHDLTDAQLSQVVAGARAAARLLADAQPDGRLLPDDAQLLKRLTASTAATREAAAAEASGPHGFRDGPLVVCAIGGDDAWARTARLGARLSAGSAIAGAAPHGALLVVRADEPPLAAAGPDRVAAWAAGAGGLAAAGQSDRLASLHALRTGSRRACAALAAAERSGCASAAWNDLGVDRLVRIDREVLDDLPPALHTLLDDASLCETMACWLEHGGGVAATAAALSLHRSGVYYRLRRAEELTGLDLTRGADRLLLHLALHVARGGRTGRRASAEPA